MRTLIAAGVGLVLVLGATSPAMAEGGKMRGSVGSGPVVQQQVMDPPPFQVP